MPQDPGEQVDAAAYPWGWETPGFDDSAWNKAQAGMTGGAKGARDYPGRLLVPTPIPPMENRTERFAEVRRSDGVRIPEGFPGRAATVTVPAHTTAEILLDNDSLTTAYLSLLFSGGKGSQITVAYAEALYRDTQTFFKDDRNEVKNKQFLGYEDIVRPDGGNGRLYTTLWWRTWRYVKLTVTTQDDPLELQDIYGTFTAYPFERASSFAAPGHEKLSRMLDIGWRTARLCANETYMDCPYYEQLQYFGDTRIQAMISLYNTRDPYMVRNALEQGRQSIVADGITMSRYPSGLHQFISSFSLYWICTGYDYWRYRGDEEYLKTLLPAFRGVLSWYEGFLREDHSLGYIPHWFFADWASNFDGGEPIREKEGNSAFQDLLFVMGLDAMAEMEQAFGIPMYGERFRKMADAIRGTIRPKYWDENKGLFADTYDRRNYSQHVNVLAVLLGAVSGNEAKAVMERTLSDTTLTQATIYFRYYLNQALQKAGLGDRLLDNLKVWDDQMALGLTTWAEQPEPSRSDCHAWGASPNIEFFRIVLGIDSDGPGFSKVRIAPSLGKLKEASGSIPHPQGDVAVRYHVGKRGELFAEISLPDAVEGTFRLEGGNPSAAGRHANDQHKINHNMKKRGLFVIASLILMLISATLQAGGLKILFIGDSITDGNWGSGDGKPSSERTLWDMNHIYGHGFMYLCASHYLGEYPQYEYEFFNRGISGNSLYDLEKRWQEDVLDINPDVLSILVGINDINRYLHGDRTSPFDFDAWDKKYRELLDRTRQENPNLKIVLASPFVAPTGNMSENKDFGEYDKIVERCSAIVEKIARDYKAVYLPYRQMFNDLLQRDPTSQNTYWIWDGVHPTAAGHQRMADLWIRQVDRERILRP